MIDSDRDRLPGFEDVAAAAEALAAVVRITPLLTDDLLDERTGCRVFVKAEFLQQGGSFKFRGIYNKLSRLSRAELDGGVVIASSGNAGLACALAARAHGATSVVVMPVGGSEVKRAAIEAAGGRVVEHGVSSDEMLARAREIAELEGRTFVHPFDQPEVIAGQGTIGLELDRQAPELDSVLVPAGGGGMLSGMALALRKRRPGLELIGVEPEGSNSIQRSLAAGRVTASDGLPTVAEGLAVQTCGRLAFRLIEQHVDDAITVSEQAIMEAVGVFWTVLHVAVEPSGAVGLAAILSSERFRGRRVAIVASGANIAPSRLAEGIAAEAAGR